MFVVLHYRAILCTLNGSLMHFILQFLCYLHDYPILPNIYQTLYYSGQMFSKRFITYKRFFLSYSPKKNIFNGLFPLYWHQSRSLLFPYKWPEHRYYSIAKNLLLSVWFLKKSRKYFIIEHSDIKNFLLLRIFNFWNIIYSLTQGSIRIVLLALKKELKLKKEGQCAKGKLNA